MFRSRWLAVIVALVLLGAACGDDDDGDVGGGTDAPAENGEAQTFDIVAEPKTEEFATAWLHFFPDAVQVHPGDTIDFEFNFTGAIHTVTAGTLIAEGLEAFEASDPEGPPPPIVEKIPFVFDEEADPAAGESPFVQAASQPCYEETDDPSTDEACEDQEQPDTFTGEQRFYNSGVLTEDEPFSVTFDESIEAGAYTFICLVHGPDMTLTVEVVDAGTDVPSPDEVRQRGEDELEAFMVEMRPPAEEVLSITSADARAGAFPEAEIPTEGINVFPREIAIAAGETVTWTVDGFHTIAFNAPEDARPPWDFQADGTFALNEKALFPQNSGEIPPPAGPPTEGEEEGPPPTVEVDGGSYDGTSFVNSGAVVDFRQLVYSLTFPDAGTYQYICLVHPDMEGSIKVS